MYADAHTPVQKRNIIVPQKTNMRVMASRQIICGLVKGLKSSQLCQPGKLAPLTCATKRHNSSFTYVPQTPPAQFGK